MSGMAEVLAAHQRDHGKRTLHEHCSCGWFGQVLGGDFTNHQAAMLTAAGFGPVKEAAERPEIDDDPHMGEPPPTKEPRTYTETDLRYAGADALEEAAEAVYVYGGLANATWLRTRAAAVRADVA